jgi:hypothetical protein
MPKVEVKGRVVDFPDHLQGEGLRKAVASAASQIPDPDRLGGAYREALETTGMLGGGLVGGSAGTVAEPGVGTAVGGVAGAALGRAFGTSAANVVDAIRGKNRQTIPQQLKQLAGSAVSGAEGEMLGQGVGKLAEGAVKALPVAGNAFLEGLGRIATGRGGTAEAIRENPAITKAGFYTAEKISGLAQDISGAIKAGRAKARDLMEQMGGSLSAGGKMADTEPVFEAMRGISKRLSLNEPLPAVPNSDAKTVGSLLSQTKHQLSDEVDIEGMREQMGAKADSMGGKGIVDNLKAIFRSLGKAQKDTSTMKSAEAQPVQDLLAKIKGSLTTPQKITMGGQSFSTEIPIEEESVSNLLKTRHAVDDALTNLQGGNSSSIQPLTDFRKDLTDTILKRAPQLKGDINAYDDAIPHRAEVGGTALIPKKEVDAQTLLRLRHRLDDEIDYASTNKTKTEAALTEMRQKVDDHLGSNFKEIKPVDAQYKAIVQREKSLSTEFGIKPGKAWEDYTAPEKGQVEQKITSALNKGELPTQVLQDIDKTLRTDFYKRAKELSITAPTTKGENPAFESLLAPGAARRLSYMAAGGGGVGYMLTKNPAYLAVPAVISAATSPKVLGPIMRAGIPAGEAVAAGAEGALPFLPPAIKALFSRKKAQQEAP